MLLGSKYFAGSFTSPLASGAMMSGRPLWNVLGVAGSTTTLTLAGFAGMGQPASFPGPPFYSLIGSLHGALGNRHGSGDFPDVRRLTEVRVLLVLDVERVRL